MTTPSSLEELRETENQIATLVHLHHYGFCENGCYKASRDKWDDLCEARAKQFEDKIRKLLRSHMEAVIKEYEEELVDFAKDVMGQYGYRKPDGTYGSGGYSTLEWAESIINEHKSYLEGEK